jgi:UPF0755 protein
MRFDRSAAVRVLAALVSVVFFSAGMHQVRISASSAADFPCTPSKAATTAIAIEKGATGSYIAKQLFQSGVVQSSEVFFRLAVSDRRSQKIAPGTHQIQKGICATQALDQLLDPQRISGLISILEGSWNSEIFAQMVTAGFKRAEIDSAVKNFKLPEGFSNLEGLLFPAQYSFATGTSADSALSAMVDRGLAEISKSGIANGQGKYSPQKLLIIASIVQAEADTADFSKVSQVIRNRIELGMPLQLDSTVHYIKKSRGKIFLSTASTLLNSDYNTYRRYGLPPGPIGNPGAAAMSAAVNPTPGDWIYFITVAPGDTRFTSSNIQFSAWKSEYQKNLKAGVFGSKK